MKRFVSWIALLSWLATPWLFWQSLRMVPKATVLSHVAGGDTYPGFSSDAGLFICGDGSHIHVYDIHRGRRVGTFPRALEFPSAFCGSTNGPLLAAYRADETVEIFDLQNGAMVASFALGPGTPVRVHLAPNGRFAATDHDNTTLRIWELPSGRCVAEFSLSSGSLGPVAFSPDSAQIVVSELGGGPVRIVDLATREISVHPNSVNRAIFSALVTADGRLVGLERIKLNQLGLWDLTNDRLLVRCPLASCGFSGNGSYWYVNHYPLTPVASIAESVGATRASELCIAARRQRQFFDTKTGRLAACIPLTDSAISPDGATLVTYSRKENCVQLWEVPRRTAVPPWLAWGVFGLAGVCTALRVAGHNGIKDKR